MEISRRFWGRFNARDWDAWWRDLDEDVEWHARADEPDAGVYHGHGGVTRLRDTWMEMFPDLRLDLAGESIEVGDSVITPTRLVGHGRTSGVDVDEPYSWLFDIREGKIVIVREYRSNAEALEAVGLPE